MFYGVDDMDYVKLDSQGNPFEFTTCRLDEKEYAKIVSEINTNYRLYSNESFCVHCSVGIDNCYYLYYFENHGYNDFNIVEKFKL